MDIRCAVCISDLLSEEIWMMLGYRQYDRSSTAARYNLPFALAGVWFCQVQIVSAAV